MASRQIKMPVKDDSDKDADEAPSQRKRPETGRYLLQVDRQTKGSYQTAEAAQSAAMVIKKGYPIVQVSVYDSVEYTHTLVEEAPAKVGRDQCPRDRQQATAQGDRSETARCAADRLGMENCQRQHGDEDDEQPPRTGNRPFWWQTWSRRPVAGSGIVFPFENSF